MMEKMNPQIAEEVVNHIKKEVLTAVPTRIDQLSSENVEALRSKLHVLHYYCLQKGFDSDITSRLEAMLETSQGFRELLEDNAKTLADLKETYKMRWLDLSSGVLTELEEVISGEESFRDIIINSIAILLGWKSDTVWVDMAKEDRMSVSEAHMVRLRDELWRFIAYASGSSRNEGVSPLSNPQIPPNPPLVKGGEENDPLVKGGEENDPLVKGGEESNPLGKSGEESDPLGKGGDENDSEITLEKAAEIGEKMNLLLRFIAADDIPVAGRVMLLSQIYILLLRLNISRILITLQNTGVVHRASTEV